MGRMELRLLGTPQVFIEGRLSTFRTRKALALLVYLAAESGMHRRDKLAELLWPASTSKRGRTALRSALASIRRALKEGDADPGNDFLKTDGDLLGISEEPELGLDLDVLREASTAARASRFDEEKDEGLTSTLRSAGAAYRGEFLDGFLLEDAPEFDLWVETQRGHWCARVGEILGCLAKLEAEEGELVAAARTAEAWAAQDPMNEAARMKLMEARAAAGDTEGALAAYEEYRSELQRLGMDPGPETETLISRIRNRAEVIQGEERHSAHGSRQIPFVGRKADFEVLVEEYRAARSGTVRSVAVLGEAGIGKTRLVEEFLGWSASRGAEILSGRTFETETHIPYEPLVDALRPRLERERAPDDLLEDRWLSELSRLLPELRDRYPDLPPPTADEASAQALLFEALARLGAALAGGSTRQDGIDGTGEPLVVFLDDLQWADRATLDALSYVSRSWERDGVPLLLLMTVREEDIRKNELDRWISSLGRETSVRSLMLTSISEGDINSLLRLLAVATVPDNTGNSGDSERLGRWLQGESDGHPLFLIQILGVLLEREVLVERNGQNGKKEIVLSGEGFDEAELRGLISSGLRELIRNKLHPLSTGAADIMMAGAVLGKSFGFGSLLRVAGVGEVESLELLDGLVSARLLEETGTSSGGAYSFTHDKIREVVYTEGGEARREVFHHRALEVLQDRGASSAELARHALAARLPEKSFDYLLTAAEEAMAVFAASDAIGHYERAQDLLELLPPGTTGYRDSLPGRLRLYGGLARACAIVYDWERAQEAYEQMLVVAREVNDRPAEWEALNGLGVLAVGLTLGPDDDELLRGVRRREGLGKRIVTAEGSGEEPEHKRSGAAHSPSSARRYAEQALLLARELGRDDLTLRSEFGLGVACAWGNRWKDSATHMEKALSFYANTSGDEEMEPQNLIRLLWSNGLAAFSRGLVDGPSDTFGPTGELQSFWRETTRLSDALDSDYARAQLGSQGLGLAWAGEYEDAIYRASRGLEASRSIGHPQFAYLSLEGLGEANRNTLALGAARSAYSEMFDWVSFPVLGKHLHARLCAVAALMGEWEQAREHALQAVGIEEDFSLPLSYLHRHHDIEAFLRGGDIELAHESLRTFEQRTRGQKGYFRLAYLRAEAVLARWNGDTDKTLSHLYESFESAQRLGLPGEIWQVGAGIGEVHEERSETGPSERAFDQSAATIRHLADNIKDVNLRQSYLAAPQTSRVLEKARGQETDPVQRISC